MASTTAKELAELNGRLAVLMGNLDQMFLLVMGCLIFCEYVFLVLVLFTLVFFYVADNHFLEADNNIEPVTLNLSQIGTSNILSKNSICRSFGN